jgi:hypothetical protein
MELCGRPPGAYWLVAALATCICGLVVAGVWSMATVGRATVTSVCPGSLLWWYVGASMAVGCCLVLPAMRLAHCDGDETGRGLRRSLWFALATSLAVSIWGYYELLGRGCGLGVLHGLAVAVVALTYSSCFGALVVYASARLVMRSFSY